jgi:MSHA biogenesis protein MshL
MPCKTAASSSAALLLFLAAALGAQAQTREDVLNALSAPVESFAFPPPGKPVAEIFDALSREYNIPIVLDKEVSGDVSFRIYGTRLRGVLDAICQPRGWHYEIVTNGEDSYAYVAVRRFVTRTYSVDYLQLSQSASSTASVSIAGSSSGSNGNGSSKTGNGGGSATNLGTGTSNGANGASSSSGGGAGSSSVSLSSSSDVDFWAKFEADVKTFIEDGESLVVNRFAGLVQLRAGLRTHVRMEAYIDKLMSRVKRSATVTVQIVRVDLNNSSKLGVDWNVASFRIGRDSYRNTPIVGGQFANAITGGITGTAAGPNTGSSTSSIATVGSASLPANSFQTVISAGKVNALLTALKEQGDVTVSNRAFVYALNKANGPGANIHRRTAVYSRDRHRV